MKYLGIDYGTKRIGVAVSDETATLAFPLGTIDAGPKALGEVLDLVRENEVKMVVIGESRDFDGKPNKVMKEIEKFAELIQANNIPVVFEDESMSSMTAARQFAPTGDRKKNREHTNLDASAAAIILQQYLDRMRS